MKRPTACLGVASAALGVVMSTALLVAPASAASTVSDPVATGLAGPLQMDVEGGRVVVAQSFKGVLTDVAPDGSRHKLYQQRNGEVAGVAIHGDAVGFLGTKYTRAPRSFLKILSADGSIQFLANLANYEAANNPDGDQKYGFRRIGRSCKQKLPGKDSGLRPYRGIEESHPYGLADSEDGSWYVADAAANDILHVTAEGDVSTVAVLPPQKYVVTKAAAEANHLPKCVVGKTFNFEPVPTDVEIDDAGQLVVSLLPGGPEDPSLGARGSVLRIDPATGERTVLADELASATNVAVNGDTTYVSELFANKITEIGADGTKTTVATVKMPAALEYADGKLWAGIRIFAKKDGKPNGAIVTIMPN